MGSRETGHTESRERLPMAEDVHMGNLRGSGNNQSNGKGRRERRGESEQAQGEGTVLQREHTCTKALSRRGYSRVTS